MLLTTIILFFVMLLLGVPVAFVILSLGIFYVVNEPAIMDVAFAQRIILGTQSFPLLAVPLFILVGELMNLSGISSRVMTFAVVLTRRMWGGLAQTNVVLSALLAGMSGSSNGDAAMQAKTLVPEMTKRGYSPAFSSVVTASSALIAPMIPPGIGLILFGFVTDLSIGRMFMAGIVPGLLLTLALMATTYVQVRKHGYEPPATEPSEETLLVSFLKALPAIMLPVIIIGGIRGGVFTPTEAAAVAVFYALVFCVVYRETTMAALYRSMRSVVSTTAAIMLVLIASSAFSWIMTFEQVPQQIGEALIAVTQNPTMMLMLIFLVLLVIGMFVEGTALILVLAPLFLPVVQRLGIDPFHYGIVFIFTINFGGITPPVGTVMFTTCSVTKVPIEDFARTGIPYFLTFLAVGMILILFPQISTFLPNL
ncbi:TRAP transporter large permease [Oricola thermophila]|uniref:TRAP transporter large permease protein n=1 Tax=Oricola thermophila TaxID=2742145 RepID=A0A6N1VIT0_9HYPH|nr:TRAP transporter large permease [Oricola thermophila]QKV19089.1 TRAP transporter large permease [Oricola thermophila]